MKLCRTENKLLRLRPPCRVRASQAEKARQCHSYRTPLIPAPFGDGELGHLQKSLKRGTPFGDRRWTQATAAKLQLESTLRPKGRPKKCTALL